MSMSISVIAESKYALRLGDADALLLRLGMVFVVRLRFGLKYWVSPASAVLFIGAVFVAGGPLRSGNRLSGLNACGIKSSLPVHASVVTSGLLSLMQLSLSLLSNSSFGITL